MVPKVSRAGDWGPSAVLDNDASAAGGEIYCCCKARRLTSALPDRRVDESHTHDHHY
ncbi:hypothetical protein [Paraburkholderia sp.]|uniref:hypothetical protein n=1 Tax=Paraburkholderia sp. TaxID=1926495 RepID=UPI002ED1CF63